MSENYENTLIGQYIRAIENPDSIGFKDGKWNRSTRKKDDPNSRGFGIDIKYNKEAIKLTKNRKDQWLTEDEERRLRNKHINYCEAKLDELLPNPKASEVKKAIAVGMIYRGDASSLYNDSRLKDIYYNGSDKDFIKAVDTFYNQVKSDHYQPERAKNSTKFMQNYEKNKTPKVSIPLIYTEQPDATRVAKPYIALPIHKKNHGGLMDNEYSVGNYANAIYQNALEEPYGDPSSHYNNVDMELMQRLTPDSRGHYDDIVKLPNHPSSPVRGRFNGKYFDLTDEGITNPNYTLFGLIDNGDTDTVLRYNGAYVLPEITVTPKGNYYDDTYNNIRIKQKADGGSLDKPKKWEELSLKDKSDIMASAVRNGITTLSEIKQKWNAFAEEGFDPTLVEEDADTMKDSATEEAHLFEEGGFTDGSYVPSATIKKDIATWEGDSMKTNRNFEAEARDFNRAIPKHIRQGLTQAQLDALFSYGYNVGMGNLKKRVGNILHQYVQGKATAEDVANNMWAAGDKKLRGLRRRRNWEKGMFINNPMEINTPAPTPQPSVGAPQPVPLFNPLFTNAVSSKPIQETPVEQPTPLLAEDDEKEADGWMLYRLLTPLEEKRKTSEENQKTSVPFIINAPSRSTVSNGLFGGGGHLHEDGSALNSYAPYFNPAIHTLPEAVVTAPRTDDFSWLSRPLTLSNDATMVENGLPYNSHLNARSLRGSSAHAQWDKEHPMLSFIGNAVAAAPLAVAAAPFALGASDALAGTALGKGITAGLTKASPYIDASMTSWGGAEAGKDIINGKPDAFTALELFPAIRVVKPVTINAKEIGKNASNAIKTAYDNGTIWDRYTTLGGRFGNYSDNPFVNVYATMARRYGLPDKARIPADAFRKIATQEGEIIPVNNNVVDLTGGKRLGYNHTNFTLDRGVTSHDWWNGDVFDTYVVPTNKILHYAKKVPGSLKSIEPSDMFLDASDKLLFKPKEVTLISGDQEALIKARNTGMQTLSSPKLRKLFNEQKKTFKKNLELYKNKSIIQKPDLPKFTGYNPPYSSEVNRLISQRGAPTLKDFNLLEKETGLNAGVAPLSEYYNAVNQLQSIYNPSIADILNNNIPNYVYPNGRVVNWSDAKKELDLVQKAKYNKVFYDPVTYAELNWKFNNKLIKP